MAPEPDDETIYDDIRRGVPPPRARDRGLTVPQLTRFFDSSVWSSFDDEDDVRTPLSSRLQIFNQVHRFQRAFSRYIETSLPASRLKKLYCLITNILPLGIQLGLGRRHTKAKNVKRQEISIPLGLILQRLKISHGLNNGVYQKALIVVCEGTTSFFLIGAEQPYLPL